MYVTNKRLDTISISSCGTKYSGFLSVDGECDSICSCTHFSQYSSPKSYKQYVLPKHITIMLETIDDTHICDICDNNVEIDTFCYRNDNCACLYHIRCLEHVMGRWSECPSCENIVSCKTCFWCSY